MKKGKAKFSHKLKRKERINEEITAKSIRLISEGNEGSILTEIIDIQSALKKAEDNGVDLVEISSISNPPVCRLIDYGRYIYQKEKKAKESKKSRKVVNLKEIKMRPKTDVHDYNFKVKHINQFLTNGDKVKVTVRFRGREMAMKKSGWDQMEKIIEDTKENGKIESQPKMEGYNMIMILSPLKI